MDWFVAGVTAASRCVSQRLAQENQGLWEPRTGLNAVHRDDQSSESARVGLNSQQALLFAFVYECPSWARLVQTPAGDFYALSKAKILEELPLLTDKPDTAYRLLKQIAAAGVIDLSSTATITLVRLTAKGQEWNRKLDGSEKYPTQVGEKSEVGNSSEVGEKIRCRQFGKISDQDRKKIRGRSEKKSVQGRKNLRQIR
ncbi:hypothetical protein [Pseudomonas aeruginosa]|uniref:hypothetical protein n=1 Tax=Pseudomonas aeruginosa TaxID=287 RepID=UPI00399C23ED